MDDHPPTASQDSSPADVEPSLDSVTAELKAELARLERERLLEEINSAIRSAVESSKHYGVVKRLLVRSDAIRSAIDAIEHFIGFYGESCRARRQKEFWVAAYKATQNVLAKLNALLAHSLQATFRTPLLLDGPELSGYKHRLR